MSRSTIQSTNNGVRKGLAYRGDTLPRNLNDSSNVAVAVGALTQIGEVKSDIDSVSVTINNDHLSPVNVSNKPNIVSEQLKISDTNYILENEQGYAIYKLYIANNKSGENLFCDKITSENGIFKKSMFVKVFTTLWTDNAIKKMLSVYGERITFEESIKCLLMVKDGATQNTYHEYMPYHDILFKLGAEKDLTQFINYYKMLSNPIYKPFYYETKNFFHARDENRFVYWLKCSLKNDKLFGPFYDDNMFNFQFNIDGKLMDICLLNKISIEFHEIGKAHEDNNNDVVKKQLSIKNGKLPFTFRMDDYENGNRTQELNIFFQDVRSALFGILFFDDLDKREQYSLNRYIQLMQYKLNNLRSSNALKLKKNNKIRIQVEDEISALSERLTDEELTKFKLIFKWKHESETNKITDKVINLDNVIKEIRSQNTNLRQELITKYNGFEINLIDGKHMIDWDFMTDIINDYSSGSIQKNLFAYLKTVQSSYNQIIDYIKGYLLKFKNINDEYHNMKLLGHKTDMQRKVDTLTYNNNELSLTIKELRKVIRTTNTVDIKMKEFLDRLIATKKIIQTSTIKDFYNKIKNNEIYYNAKKLNRSLTISDFNFTDIGEQIFPVEGFPIIFTDNNDDSITLLEFNSTCSEDQFNIPSQLKYDFLMSLSGSTKVPILRKIKFKTDDDEIEQTITPTEVIDNSGDSEDDDSEVSD